MSRAIYLIYTDGSCKPGSSASAGVGPGGWGFLVRAPDGTEREGFGSAQGTLAKVMEYRAVAEALVALPEGAAGTVFSDNQSLCENLEKRLADWSRSGFARTDETIVESLRAIDAIIRERRLTLTFQWVRGHNTNAGNERADALAAQGARAAKAVAAGGATKRRR